ncbi:hypothetical protein [uncultured Campylobacter sp.]|uniref:hypothetical protein n=1 Tax=uncultured Campylobacter sp. TaxID=218934 RepID=UPI003211AD90
MRKICLCLRLNFYFYHQTASNLSQFLSLAQILLKSNLITNLTPNFIVASKQK